MKFIYSKLPFLFLTFLVICNSVTAQDAKLRKADKSYENYAFIQASEIYKDVAESGYESSKLYENLSNALYFNANYKEAAKWFEKYFSYNSSSDDIPAIYYLRYSQSLKVNNNIEEAKRYYNLFLEKAKSKGNINTASEYLDVILDNSDQYDLKKLELQSSNSNFGSVIHDGKLFFSSARDTGTFSRRRDSWNNQPFMDIYQTSAVNSHSDESEAPKKLKGKVNTKFHESSPCFTKDGNTMYFTTTNTSKTIKQDVRRLKICKATYSNGKWTDILDLSINSDEYSTAHPSLNEDETKLYFASDMPGTKGETDIFVANIDNGRIGLVERLGNNINTEGRESFPYISPDNKLYFASDGHFGLGGLDVFYTDLNSDNKKIVNLGKPINSEYDDFAYNVGSNKQEGYVSSNRDDESAYGNIYKFTTTIKDIDESQPADIVGYVRDKYTDEPIINTNVIVYNVDDQMPKFITATDSDGHYVINVERDQEYTVRVDNNNYNKEELYIKTLNKENELNFQLTNDQIDDGITRVGVGDNLNDVLATGSERYKNKDKFTDNQNDNSFEDNEIRSIYFDLNKSDINGEDQVIALQLIVSVLKRNPSMLIEVQSHTDSRGSDAYNLRLSKNRLDSTVNYIVSQGVDRSRISGSWFGESQLLNHCDDGVPCTEAQHRVNRRSEFIIVRL